MEEYFYRLVSFQKKIGLKSVRLFIRINTPYVRRTQYHLTDCSLYWVLSDSVWDFFILRAICFIKILMYIFLLRELLKIKRRLKIFWLLWEVCWHSQDTLFDRLTAVIQPNVSSLLNQQLLEGNPVFQASRFYPCPSRRYNFKAVRRLSVWKFCLTLCLQNLWFYFV